MAGVLAPHLEARLESAGPRVRRPTKSARLPLCLGLALAVLGLDASGAQDWPHFRGPVFDGTAGGDELPAAGALGLELVWKRSLGSGYSSISVADGIGAALFSDGESDFVTAFDAGTGAELWRYRIGDAYRGHDGSRDGPLSTPAIHDGIVFALGPRGELAALDAEDGRVVWTRAIGSEPGSRAPMYGYATAPVVAGGLLIVQGGGSDGRSITAFDPRSGEVRWQAEDDPVSYQSPAVLELLGRRQLVAAGDGFVLGLDPATGEVLWKHRHTEEGKALGASAHPLRLADDRLLVRPSPDDAVVYGLTEGDGGVALDELWRVTLKRSHAALVPHDGKLYSFDNHFLTCIDAGTGERLWKSRPPGGRGLIRVGGYLVMLASKGHVVVAEASPEGYREAARLRVFDDDGWTPPSFADGHLFVRNLDEMASLRIVRAAAAAPRPERVLRGRFGELVRRIESATERTALVERFMSEQDAFPIIEEDGLVHFVYRGEARDVAVSGNMTEDFGEEAPMTRVADTGLFFRTFELDPVSHYEYRFHVDFGGPIADPRNPHPIGSIFGPSSELRMPGWTVPESLAGGPLRGRVETVDGEERPHRIYLPPGYDATEERYPLIVVQQGEGGETARAEGILDRLIGGGAAPAVAVFLPRLRREHDAAALAGHARWVTAELVPRVDRTYRTLTGPEHRGLLGTGGGAPVAAWTAFEAPGVFGKLALQSFFLRGLFGKLGAGALSMTPEAQDELWSRIRSGQRQALELYVEWSVHESVDASSGLDVRADTERLLAALESAGYSVRRNEVRGAPGYGSWRAQYETILETFFQGAPR